MTLYKIKWCLKSPYGTQLQSDTIFRHIAWALVYLYGESRFAQILSGLMAEPQMVLSSAFPPGYLPSPQIMAKIDFELMKALYKYKPEHEIAWSEFWKEFKRRSLISQADLLELEGGFDPISYCHMQFKSYLGSPRKVPSKAHPPVFHNKINRLSGTTDAEEGGLFAEEVFWKNDERNMESYLSSSEILSFQEWITVFEFISDSGYGKNKSTGRGELKVSLEPIAALPSAKKPNAHLLISNMVPRDDDPTNCSYTGKAKYGKTGGTFANGISPFKYPFYMLLPGSVFYGAHAPVGRMLADIHPENKAIAQNLYAMSIPIEIREG